MKTYRLAVLLSALFLMACYASKSYQLKGEENDKQTQIVAQDDNAQSAPGSESHIQEMKDALSQLNGLVGSWRGVGMLKRNSPKGAWIEKAEWKWNYRGKQPAIEYVITKGDTHLKSAEITYHPKSKQYQLKAVLSEKLSRTYRGRFQKGKLVFESQPDDQQQIYKVTITPLNEKRTLVLHEKRNEKQSFARREFEVGYTREGTSLAVRGAGERVCVVSGGKGTTAVTYKGETYYVCCSGCKQAFEDDPETIIAEYKSKLAKQKQSNK